MRMGRMLGTYPGVLTEGYQSAPLFLSGRFPVVRLFRIP